MRITEEERVKRQERGRAVGGWNVIQDQYSQLESSHARFYRRHKEKELADKQLYTALNRELIDKAKDVPCKKCGVKFPPVCMDLHHRNPTEKLFNVGTAARSRGPKQLLAEIAKCDVYCANCHRIVTAAGIEHKIFVE